MAVNLDGTFLTNYYAQKAMRENGYGRIVNIASNVILAGTPNLAHYVASKGGVWAFTRALARELGPHGITVNSVAPGLTETEGVLASKHAEAFDFVQMLQAIPRRGGRRRHRAGGRVPRLGGGRLGDRAADRRGRRAHAQLMARRAGAILAVADVERSVAFYRDQIGFEVEASLRRPAVRHARPRRCAGSRSRSRGIRPRTGPGSSCAVPADPSRADVVLVIEVDDARAEHRRLAEAGVRFLAEPYEPPWGGCRFFCVDPDGYLVEIEQPAVKAVVLRAPGDVGVDDVADPAILDPGDAIVAVARDGDLRRRPLPLPRA